MLLHNKEKNETMLLCDCCAVVNIDVKERIQEEAEINAEEE